MKTASSRRRPRPHLSNEIIRPTAAQPPLDSALAMTVLRPSLETTLDRAWQRLSVLLATLCAMMPPGWAASPAPLSQPLRRRILRLLRPGEALARRLILTMARELRLDPPPPPKSAPGLQAPARRDQPSSSLRSGFRLTEPIASLRAAAGCPSVRALPFRRGPGPRILSFDEPGTVVNRIDDTDRTPRVKIRLMALLTAVKAPGPLAQRLARRLLAARASGRLRRLPLKPGHAAGWSCRHTPAWLKDALSTFTAEARGWPPPPSVPLYRQA